MIVDCLSASQRQTESLWQTWLCHCQIKNTHSPQNKMQPNGTKLSVSFVFSSTCCRYYCCCQINVRNEKKDEKRQKKTKIYFHKVKLKFSRPTMQCNMSCHAIRRCWTMRNALFNTWICNNSHRQNSFLPPPITWRTQFNRNSCW